VSGAQERIREATIQLVVAHGVAGTSIDAILARAGVGDEEFRALYEDKQGLMLALYEDVAAGFDAAVYEAFDAHDSWRDGLRACAYTAARYLRDHPEEVSFGAIQLFEAGDLAQVYRERQLQRMVDLIDLGRQELEDPESMGRGVAEGVIGSIYSMLVKELHAGRGTVAAVDFVPQLMYMAVRPYLGHEVAREELTIPPPAEARK
jgi:AcrR family transcriptional regulator